MKPLPFLAVVATAPVVGADTAHALVSVAVGLVGVVLARAVFLTRQKRQTGHGEPWRDTLPMTLAAMLLAGVLIFDRRMGVSSAAVIGLGLGTVAVVMLDILGERALAMLRTLFGLAAPKE